jgi:two-component system response regulator YesN
MMEADRERQARAKALIEALLLQTLEEFENDMPLRIGKADKTFRMIIEHMRQNYFLPVNRESVCRDLGLNPSYVSSLFKKKSGENFNSCLNRLRMEEAMSILKNYPDIDVKTLAQQCGFSDHGYFIKVFKKFYGSTPGKISFSQNP